MIALGRITIFLLCVYIISAKIKKKINQKSYLQAFQTQYWNQNCTDNIQNQWKLIDYSNNLKDSILKPINPQYIQFNDTQVVYDDNCNKCLCNYTLAGNDVNFTQIQCETKPCPYQPLHVHFKGEFNIEIEENELYISNLDSTTRYEKDCQIIM